jgi:hypothetical protein
MSAARTTPIALAAVLAASLLALTHVAPAHASPASVIRDCSEDGVLNGKYSQSELDGALEQLPSDLDEYTDCRAVIRSAQLGSAGRKHRAARGASAAERVDAGAPASNDEQKEIADAAGSGDAVRIGGAGVRPGQSGKPFNSAGFGTDLPSLVLIVLIALAGVFAAGAVLAVRRRWGDSAVAGGLRRGISRFRR